MAPKKNTRQRPAAKPSRIDAVRDLVGVLTDAEVAARAGVTSSAVHQYRQRHGIKPALPQGTTRRALERRKEADEGLRGEGAAARRGRRPVRNGSPVQPSVAESDGEGLERRRSKIDNFRYLVGVLPDPDVAERAGVTRTAVQMYRKKHGIPPAGPPGDPAVARSRVPPAQPAPAQRSVASSGGGARSSNSRMFAFKVTVTSRQGEIVKIIVAEDAAVAADRARALGDVVGVERLGEAM